MSSGIPVMGGGAIDPSKSKARVEPLVLRAKEAGPGGRITQEMVDQANTVEDLLNQLGNES
ncbi:MAG TPA: hypothetical protein VK545_12060 [Streptomyces sp.]|nr:hypothetical protein [Streptomyces sp.]